MRYPLANSILRKTISFGELGVVRQINLEVIPRGLKPAAQNTISKTVLIAVGLFVSVLFNMQNVLGDQESHVGRDDYQAPLERLVGLWNCTEHHFNEVGQEVAQIEAYEQIDWILDQNAIRRNYSRSQGRTSYRAVGMLSWNQATKRYEGSWFDNVSVFGPSTVVGRWEQAKLQFAFELTVASGPGKTSTYTVVETFIDENKREATTYEHRGKETFKRMKVVYQRTAPCPESTEMRAIGLNEEFAPRKKNKD